MESLCKAGRSVGNGVYRVADALARGARRMLAFVPLLGIAPPSDVDTAESPTGGEEAENAASSPVEEKLAVSSPTAENESAPAVVASPTAATEAVEAKEEVVATSAASSPIEEKKEEPTPSAPTPVPVEDKKEEVEKVEAEKKVVEVSPASGQSIADPVEVSVFRVQPVATPSIIERKTSEDLPSQPPSSPPPTPIDPSPLQQAQQAAASATALAEALKLPAEAAADDKDQAASMPSTEFSSPSFDDERHSPPQPSAEDSSQIPQHHASSRDEPQTEAISSPKLETAVESLPVVEEVAAAIDRVSPVDVTTKEASPSIASQEKIETRTINETETETIKTDQTLLEQRDAIPQSPSLTEGTKSISETETFQTASQTVSEVIPNGISESVPASTPCAEVLPESTENVPESASENDEKVIEDIPVLVEENISVIQSKVVESIPVATEQLVDNQKVIEPSESTVEQIANVECIKDTPKESTETTEIVGTKIVVPSADLIIDSEEGPVSVSEEILVEAKPAYVIPEDDIVEENTEDSKADNTESVEVIVEVDEEKLENEPESDTAVPTEGILVTDEPEDASVQEDVTIETSLPINETMVVTDKLLESEKDIIEMSEVSEISEIDDTIPPPPESPMLSSQQDAVDIDSYPSTVETEPITISEAPQPEEKEPPSPKQRVKSPDESSLIDSPVIPESPVVQSTNELVCSINEKVETSRNDSQTIDALSSRLENVSVSVSQPSDDLPPPAPLEAVECANSSEYIPLPPEELACSYYPNDVSEIPRELPVSDEHASDLRNPTETLLTPPRSPSPCSNVSNASGVTTATHDCSQTQLHDDQSNREFKTESVSLSLNSYNDSDVELKERLAESLTETLAETVAETANQEETLSCQLSNNNAMPTAAQENHQSTPEPEVPVENNVAHVTNTIESAEEAPKVVAPTVPVEAPASPPTAPAITEDVASVTKAIEEIDISDKAVAAAVNESIECQTNEIIADINE